MGMTAVLLRLPRQTLEELVREPNRLEDIMTADDPHLEERVAGTLDLDKAWHGVHFLLTGTAWEGRWPLAFLVEGGTEIGEDETARAFSPEETRQIAGAVRDVTRTTLEQRFEPAAMTELDIYPPIWDRAEEETESRDWLLDTFASMQELLAAATRADEGLLLVIG